MADPPTDGSLPCGYNARQIDTPMRYCLILCFLLVSVSPALSAPHAVGQSYAFVRVYDDAIEVRLEITSADLNRALQIDLGDPLTVEDVERHLDAIRSYVESRLWTGTPQGDLPLRYTGYDIRSLNLGDYVLLHYYTEELAEIPEQIDIEYAVLFDFDTNHRNLLVIEHNWSTATFNNESNVSLIFSPSNPRQTLQLAKPSIWPGLLGFIRLGTWHIWIGLDHILFLLALALPSVLYRERNRWMPVASFRPAFINILAIVTSFTVAHSITLSLAALELVRLPSRLVESVIAASIVIAALHNLYPRFGGKEWIIAFVFGLFHGFGFAYVLTDIGLERSYLVLSLLGFNLGVEAGQIVIIAALFLILFLIREKPIYTEYVLKYCSLLLISVAGFWFAERALALPMSRYPERLVRKALAYLR